MPAANPLATADQGAVEETALRLLARPELARARATARFLWHEVLEYSAADQRDRLDNMIEEYVFHYVFRAANSDAAYPKIARFMAPAHHWQGRDIPGSRWAGDSPDFIYRILPLSAEFRYEIHGQVSCATPPLVAYQLLATRSGPIPLGLLDSLDMEVSPTGAFTLTLDATPADGRPNHLQMPQDADHMMIRDALSDWRRQQANELHIRRLDPPGRPPLTEESLAERAARNLLDAVYYAHYIIALTTARAPNLICPPASSGPFGGMPTQWTAKALIELAEDEAYIITANEGGARFRNAVLQDLFMLSIDYWSHTTSLNNRQMAPDADGGFTYVIAHADPGIHNWLDTRGLRRTVFGQRWQAIPRGYAGPIPSMTGRKVKFADLAKELPDGVRKMDAAGRRAQLAERLEGFKSRF